MSRRHRRNGGGHRPTPRGWDTVKTPFGYRTVPKGRGWAEASKWAMLRLLAQALLWGSIIALGWLLLAKIAATLHP